MPITPKADIAIVGAGIAGLSLATQIKQDNPSAAVTLVGPKDRRPQRISTWIDSTQSIPACIGSCIDNQWSTWGFRDSSGRIHPQRSATSSYTTIDGRRLKDHLEECAVVTAINRIDENCHSVVQTSTGYQLVCESQTLVSTQLVDTRPPAIPNSTIKQQFVGHTIRCTQPHQQSLPLLMDFSGSSISQDGLTFIYCLPLSDCDLLVEATTFSPTCHTEADYETCIEQWIETNLPAGITWKPIDTESGVLPMGPIRPIDHTLVRCGLAGGAARASTGYAWHGTQRQVAQLASQFSNNTSLSQAQAYSRKAQHMDALFLRVLRHQPQAIYHLFMAMAQHLSGDILAQFLCDEGGWRPCLRTIKAAPKWPFIRALWRS